MGMDVYGRAPKSKKGEYFRASIWSWPGILDSIYETGVLPEKLVERMAYNDGAGPDETQAIALADALDAKVASLPKDASFVNDESHYANVGTATVARQAHDILSSMPGDLVSSFTPNGPDFSVDVEFIKEFAEFCRNSGGFEVW